MNHLPTEEYTFKWLQDKATDKRLTGLEPCTRLRRVVYVYEYAREYLSRLHEKQAEIFGNIFEGDKKDKGPLDAAALSELESRTAPFTGMAHHLDVHLSRTANIDGQPDKVPDDPKSFDPPSEIELVTTPFQLLEASKQVELLEEFGPEIDTLLRGSSFLTNHASFLKPWNPDTVKKHPQLQRMFIQRWKEFRREFFAPEKSGEVWLIAKFDMNETSNQRLRRFQDFEKRARSALSKFPEEEQNQIKAKSKTGRGEGPGNYVKSLTSLGGLRAVRHYRDWETAFAHTQSKDPRTRRKTPLLSHEKRKWERTTEIVNTELKDLFGTDLQ